MPPIPKEIIKNLNLQWNDKNQSKGGNLIVDMYSATCNMIGEAFIVSLKFVTFVIFLFALGDHLDGIEIEYQKRNTQCLFSVSLVN